MKYSKILHPDSIKNRRYHFTGAALAVMNYFRHILLGYKTPRTFPSSEIEKTVDYDLRIVERWTNYLRNYSGDADPLQDKVVLELGVGPDLGTGAILLAMGARKYFALDVNNLAELATEEFYNHLFERMREDYNYVDFAEKQVRKYLKKEESLMSYIVDNEFRISAIPGEIDVVVSQAAFEHFDDIEKTIIEISDKIKKGGILIIHVDMKTHTRWIKDKDPLNIYRYSELFWNTFRFRGSPNRERIPKYRELFEKNNWTKIIIEPRTILDEKYMVRVIPTLDKKYRDLDIQEMRILSFILIARKN